MARAQSVGAPLPVVAVLSPISPVEFAANLTAFRRGLRDAGLVEGDSVRLELRFSGGVPERLPVMAAELVALRPNAIVAGSTAGAQAAARATRQIPIVFIGVTDDPVALGLVASLAQPGGNVTGFTLADDLGLIGKRLELLREMLPRAGRVVALANPNDTTDASLRQHLPAAARSVGLSVELLEVRARGELAGAVAAARQRGDAMFVSLSPLFNVNRVEVAALAAQQRLPAIYGFREFVEAGGLMAYGPSLAGLYQTATGYVARILKGESPAVLPVQQPTSFSFVLNLNAARKIDLVIPEALLNRADEVIE
ncbi:MAG: ABC transporter substrate-binding protein [Alphaproteobacteria bacterium]|nr:ABC transporter substrate-binding protein [Alphaproteobacteria bacterium]